MAATTEIEAPPVGEEIHMPEPSLLPILNAAGLSLAIVGITHLAGDGRAGPHPLPRHAGASGSAPRTHEISELPAEHSAAH